MADVVEGVMRLVFDFVFEFVFHGVGRGIRWLVGGPEPADPDTDGWIGLVALLVLAIAACTLAFGSKLA
jgi:hypothetical protein